VAQRHRGRVDGAAPRVLRDLLPSEQRDRRWSSATSTRSRRWSFLARHFGPIPASDRPIPQVYTAEPPQEGERRFVVRRAGQIAWCAMSWRTVAGAPPRHGAAGGPGQRAGRRHHVASPPGARREDARALGHRRAMAAPGSRALLRLRAGPAGRRARRDRVRDPARDRAHRVRRRHRGECERRGRRSRPRSSSTATRRSDRRVAVRGDRRRGLGVVRRTIPLRSEPCTPRTCAASCSRTSTTTR
jgi:hypothetical protein